MDHVFALMESYAANLRREVEEKTKEAIEEKKRADLLLYKILPPSVQFPLKFHWIIYFHLSIHSSQKDLELSVAGKDHEL